MRRREDIITELEEMGYIATTKDIYKLTTDKPDEFYAVDFRVGVPIAFKWQDNERITDKEDVRVKDDGKFLAVYYTVSGLDAVAGKMEASEKEVVNEFADDEQSEFNETSNIDIGFEDNKSFDSPLKKLPSGPIKGIKGIVPQLCECGKIKIGKKGKVTQSRKGNSFRPPEKLDHFVVTTMQKTTDDDFETDHEIMSKLGESCTEIPVMLMYDTPDLNFVTSLAYYDSAACQCRGNGEIAIKADGTCIKCDPDNCTFAQQKKCKPNGVLSVVITEAPRVGGVWKFRTTGWNSIRNLMSSIEFIYGLTGGRLAGLPLMLTLQPKSTVIPGTSTKTTIYMVNMEYRGTMAQLMNSANTRYVSEERMKALEERAAERLSLPESADECKDIQEEFYPETFQR